MNGQDDRFRFSVELGRRLRELRQEVKSQKLNGLGDTILILRAG